MSGSEQRSARFANRTFLVAVGIFAVSACHGRRDEHAQASKTALPAVAKSHAKPQLAHRSQPAAPLEQFVQQHVEEADASGQRVLVYVGATWCEPCQRFHKALESGQLDEALAGSKLIEFGLDRDRSEHRAAVYPPQFIPLFSWPD